MSDNVLSDGDLLDLVLHHTGEGGPELRVIQVASAVSTLWLEVNRMRLKRLQALQGVVAGWRARKGNERVQLLSAVALAQTEFNVHAFDSVRDHPVATCPCGKRLCCMVRFAEQH